VVEDLQRVGASDCYLERLALAKVAHDDGESVVAPSPEQRHEHTVVSANGQLLEGLV
jgi:hypothetical protein